MPLIDEDRLQIAELLEHLGQVNLPVLDVGEVVDLCLVLLEALDKDVFEGFLHLSLRLWLVLMKHLMVLGLGLGKDSLGYFLSG